MLEIVAIVGGIGGLVFGIFASWASYESIKAYKKDRAEDKEKEIESAVRMSIRVEQLENKTKINEDDIRNLINQGHQTAIVLASIKQTNDMILTMVSSMSKKLDNHLENHDAR